VKESTRDVDVKRAKRQPSDSAPAETEDTAHLEDVGWVRAVRQGNAEAFGPLVDRYAPLLHALLRRFFREPADVDDVLQETLVRAFRNLERYDPGRPFYPWLRRIAVNLALNELEKRKRRPQVDDPEEWLDRTESPLDTSAPVREQELSAAVSSELEDLPPAWAAVFRLRTFEDMTYAEIAEALDVPLGTVMSQLARARARLAAALAARFGPRREP
jgi:RNA polymerase sigma-70 factor (ECF subfamily)